MQKIEPKEGEVIVKKQEVKVYLPMRFENVCYEHVPEQIKEKFEKILETRRGIFIHGKSGVGKTHVAYALMKNCILEKDRSAKVVNVPELLHNIRNDFNVHDRKTYEFSEAESINKYRGLLILDDIGAEKCSDWVLETFYIIINNRYNQILPTIFTSNLTIQEFAEHYGDRITSRVVGMCDIYEMTGEDRRLA